MLAVDASNLRNLLAALLKAANSLELRLEEEAAARRFERKSLANQHQQHVAEQRALDARLLKLEAEMGDEQSKSGDREKAETVSSATAAALDGLEKRIAATERTVSTVRSSVDDMAELRKELLEELASDAATQRREQAARVEKQLKSMQEELGVRLEEAERRSEARAQKLHGDLVKKVSRTELEQATEDLQQQLLELQKKFGAQLAELEKQHKKSFQKLEADLPQMKAHILEALANVNLGGGNGGCSSACTTTCISCFRPRSTSPPKADTKGKDLVASILEAQWAGGSRPASARRGFFTRASEQSAAAASAVSPAVSGLPPGPSIPTLPRSPHEELHEEAVGPFEVQMQRERQLTRRAATDSLPAAGSRPTSAVRRPHSARATKEVVTNLQAPSSLAVTAARLQVARDLTI